MKLKEYIYQHHRNNQAAFARLQSVTPQMVQEWINKGYIVVNGTLYSPRRELKGEE